MDTKVGPYNEAIMRGTKDKKREIVGQIFEFIRRIDFREIYLITRLRCILSSRSFIVEKFLSLDDPKISDLEYCLLIIL